MKKSILLLFLFVVLQQLSLFAQGTHLSTDTLKLLAIGNSFSEDGIENYLHELATATGKNIVIGNLYIGGAPLSLHLRNIEQNNSSYDYRKIGLDGKKVETHKTSIASALADETWNYISFQQASPLSGKYETVQASLPELVKEVRSRVGTNPLFLYHQTWAYQQDSQHEGFKNYNNDQLAMYKSIVDVSKKVRALGFFAAIVPAGTAIQNARSSSLGDHFTRDGYHLQLDYGRFTAACTWYEILFKDDVRKNPYKPTQVSDLQAKIAKTAAHSAVKRPFRISKVRE